MVDKLKVMVKDGKSYIKLPRYYMNDVENYLINGEVAVRCKGDSDWAMVDGTINSVQSIITTRGPLIGFKLREEYEKLASENLPLTLPPDSDLVDDDKVSGMYSAVFAPETTTYKPIDFEVISLDSAPVIMPKYVKVDFPASVAEHKEIHHKYPCRIQVSDVFTLVYKAIAEHIDAHKDIFIRDDYERIQTLTVKRRIFIPESVRKPEKRQYFPTLRSRKMKTEIVTPKERFETVLKVVGTYKNDGSDIQIGEVTGKNYADLCKNLKDYIQSFIDRLDPVRISVCEHCGGSGLIRTT